jgi:plasmid stability protein
MATQITVRGVSKELHERLRRLALEEGESLNATVLRLLQEAVGLDERRRRLERYASWTGEDLAEFETALGWQRRVDDELWTE